MSSYDVNRQKRSNPQLERATLISPGAPKGGSRNKCAVCHVGLRVQADCDILLKSSWKVLLFSLRFHMSQINNYGAIRDTKKCQNSTFERTPRAGRLRFFHQTCLRVWRIELSFTWHLTRVYVINSGVVIKDFVFWMGQFGADNSAAMGPTALKLTSKVVE